MVICTLAAVIYGLPANEEERSLVANQPNGIAADPKFDQPARLVDGDDSDDLEKSETFGFGYKHYYYPRSYGYHSYYHYPSYYHYRPWYYKRYYW